MRTIVFLFATSLLLSTNAQADLQKMIQERMAAGGVKVEEDNSPFEPNTFIGSFRMEMHMFENGKELKNSPTNMRYWSSADKTMNKMDLPDSKGQDIRMMTDLKGKWQYTLMTDDKGKKMAMKSRKMNMTVAEAEAKKDEKQPEVKVTDETKTIEGHVCTKVIATSEDGTWTGWVAKDIDAPFADLTRNAKQKRDDPMQRAFKGISGFPLEFEWVDAKGKERMVGYMKELELGSVDERVFSLDGYEVMEMPSFGH